MNIRCTKTFHINFGQISIQITSKIIVIAQIIAGVRSGERGQYAGVHMESSVSIAKHEHSLELEGLKEAIKR